MIEGDKEGPRKQGRSIEMRRKVFQAKLHRGGIRGGEFSRATPPCIFKARRVATRTIAEGARPDVPALDVVEFLPRDRRQTQLP